MNGSTTDVIVARSQDVDRLSTMVMWSVAAHIIVTAVVVLMPHSKPDLTPKEVMTITIGGAPGPRTGMTQMGARAVQAPEPPIKQAEAAPSPVKPEMTLPDPKSKPRPQPKTAPKEAAAKTLSTGAEPQEGTAKAETRVRGQGFGLSSGGGGGTGGVTVDAVNFCCPDYINTMAELVRQNWNGNKGITGVTKMMFTITRSGRLEGIKLETSSGFPPLDEEAARALKVAQLPPLPTRYTNPTLTVHLEFAYQR